MYGDTRKGDGMVIKNKEYILPADFKKGWIDGLRSGKYKQVDGVFYDVGCGYCAIGVALVECHSIDKSFLAGMSTLNNICENYEIPYADVKIPWRYSASGSVEETTDLEEIIMEMNDGDGASFNEIADWIEVNIEESI